MMAYTFLTKYFCIQVANKYNNSNNNNSNNKTDNGKIRETQDNRD